MIRSGLIPTLPGLPKKYGMAWMFRLTIVYVGSEKLKTSIKN
jgi:hypothetical protein